MNLPILVRLIVGRQAFAEHAKDHHDGTATYYGALATIASMGVAISLATDEEWPPRVVVGVDSAGGFHVLNGPDGRPFEAIRSTAP